MNSISQCEAITKQGQRCKRTPLSGLVYCAVHKHLVYGYPRPKTKVLDRPAVIQIMQQAISNNQPIDLSFCDLSGAGLSSSSRKMPSFKGALLGKYADIQSGCKAINTMFQRNNMEHAKLIYGDYSKASFFACNLQQADMRYGRYDDAIMVNADLKGANLNSSSFDSTNFLGCNLQDADLYLARFSGKTNLGRENFKGLIIQESEERYRKFVERAILPESNLPLDLHLKDRLEKGIDIYQHLRSHFKEMGQNDDARWAYLRQRRLIKQRRLKSFVKAFQKHEFKDAGQNFINWVSDQFIEWLCDYGESIWRVIIWLIIWMTAIGPLLFGFAGGFFWPRDLYDKYVSIPSPFGQWLYSYFQTFLYTIDTLTTSNYSLLLPKNDIVRLISGLLAIVGIFLAGLLGFVTGNRISNT